MIFEYWHIVGFSIFSWLFVLFFSVSSPFRGKINLKQFTNYFYAQKLLEIAIWHWTCRYMNWLTQKKSELRYFYGQIGLNFKYRILLMCLTWTGDGYSPYILNLLRNSTASFSNDRLINKFSDKKKVHPVTGYHFIEFFVQTRTF